MDSRTILRHRPLIQAPMAGSQGVRLALAVAEGGGLGSLAAAMLSPQALGAALQTLAGVDAPFNVNFFCHQPPLPDAARTQAWRQRLAPYFDEAGLSPPAGESVASRQPFGPAALQALASHRPAIVSFHFGLPAPEPLRAVRALGCQVWSSATTVEEARWLIERGVDALIVQGLEAGGHRGHFLRDDLDLEAQCGWRELLDAVRPLAGATPLIAAGGLMTPDDVAEALARGASAAQLGTAFLGCPEADTSAVHRAALARGGTTALTNLFSGRPARGLVNRLMREVGPFSPDAPAFPLASNDLAPLRQAAEARGHDDFSPLWAGTGVTHLRQMPAAELVRWLCSGLTPAAGT